MDLTDQNKAKKGPRVKKINSSGSVPNLNSNTYSNSNSDALLIIRIPDSRVLQIVSRSFFLAIVLIALPIISPFMSGGSSNSGADFDVATTIDILPVIFPDLIDEGLVRRGDKGLIVGSGMGDDLVKLLTGNNGIDLDTVSKLNEISFPILNGAFDFVLGLNLKCIKCVDRVVKTNGIVITRMKNEPSSSSLLLQSNPNYRIVYLRRWFKDNNSNTIVAMRKARFKDGLTSSSSSYSSRGKMGRICGTKHEARKVALKGLEDALLEPPRMKSMNGRGEMKFLPDLTGDSLQAYKRRMFIFISDDKNGGGGGGGAEEWFYKNYPTRNQHFEVVSSSSSAGISDWMRRNVGKQDFVVMKAGEELVEEMMKDKTICLVDELFVECRRRQWPANEAEETETETETETEIESKRKRAYWQCLALYGDLREEGVAVHQWWS